jgi:hypothetical protein
MWKLNRGILRKLFVVNMLAIIALFPTNVGNAALTITITDAGGGSTNWTISGSGTTGGALTAAATTGLLFPTDFISTGFTASTSGSWSFNGHTTDAETFNPSFSDDPIEISFDTDFSAGESLAGASGTVVFPINIANIDLTDTGTSTIFGAVTIVPEPNALATGFAMALLGIIFIV